MTEKQLLSIDLSLMSTEMFPSVAENEKNGPGTTITEKEASPSTENDQEKGKGPKNDIPVTPVPQCLSGAKLWIVITCVIVVAWLMFLDSSIIVTAIPAITDEFHSLQDIGWYGSAYHVSNAAFQPLTALMGLVIGLANSGSVCGPVLGGVLTDYANWRWTFYINLPIGGVVLLFLAWCEIPDQVPKPSPMAVIAKLHTYLDFTGFLLCAGAAVSFLTALELGGNEYAFNSPTIIGLFCGSAVALVTFLAWNYRKGDDGLIPSSMVGRRPVWSAAATNFTFVGSAMIQIYLLPLYFQAVQGATPAQSGINVLPSILSQLAFAYGGGVLANVLVTLQVGKFGYYLPWAVAGTAATIIASGLFTSLTPTTSVAQWVGYQIITGGGRGIVLQLFMGSAVALAASNAIFTGALKQDLPKFAPNVDASIILEAGATGFRKVVPEGKLPGVLLAYVSSIDKEFYLSLGLAIASFCFAWGMGWKDIRPKKKQAVSRRGKERMTRARE
ncbi:efflux pump [Colletotrichum simmondsii]|uniref:Efflux pump n=1 Tax=Colletotrichum simmondsii TaxID=703756 RepID=A0A135SK10_9PEZI|nr:efflux pump [Colletotrichum simmondsii]